MFKRFHLSIKHRWLGILCLISLSLGLWIGHIPLANKSVELGQAVNAQTPAASQQMRQGIDRYQAQDYLGAIALWQQVLETTNNSPANTAILRENLARAYQQMGQFDRAIAYWQPTIDYYRQIGDPSTTGLRWIPLTGQI
jgi:tetratricopeptide (TPR) repeat protein